MPWEKQYDESEVLERAMRAFWARGYEATSINDLVKATGINRGSIYAAFADKRGLFIEALRHYDKHHRLSFLDDIARAHAPRDAILAAFAKAAENTPGGKNPGGCLLVNTALEVSPHDPEIRAFVQACLDEVEGFFRAMIEAAQRDRTIAGTVPPETTAKALLGLFLGLRVLTRTDPNKDTLAAITSQAESLLARQ